MALNSRPTIYSAKLLTALEKSLVFAGPGVVNKDYEGEIRQTGDTVKITTIGDPTIGTYVKGSTVISPEQLTDAQRSLQITESKYFAFEIDDIDAVQHVAGAAAMATALMRAAYKLRDAADQFVAAKYTEAQTANQLGTVSVTTADLAYSTLVDLSVALDEADVQTEGRYVIVPPWYHGLLLENSKFVTVNASGTSEGLRNGIVGRAVGFDILKSNNCVNVTGDDFAVMAGVDTAISYADQIVKTEIYRPEDSFSDAIKGLHVYGAKVVRPDSLATVIASKT